MPSVQAGELRMYYVEEGAGPLTLLLVHGYTACSAWWEPTMAGLRDRYRLLAVDLRGAGQTEQPPGGYTLRQYAEDLFAFTRALGLRDFVYVGHSMGGLIGLQFALEHGSTLRGLVLVDPASADGMEAGQTPDPEQTAAFLSQFKTNRTVADGFLRASFFRPVEPVYYARLLDNALHVSDGHLRDSLAAMTSARLGERLGEIRVPTLLVMGDRDALVRPAAMLRTYQRIPGCGLHAFHRTGHSPQIEVPEAFNAVLHEFVQETIPEAAGA